MDALTIEQSLRRSLDPTLIMRDADIEPQPWQADALRNWRQDHLFLTSRHAGKTTTAGAIGAYVAREFDEALVVLASPAQRQSGESFRKARKMLEASRKPVTFRQDAATMLELSNGSRIVAVPGSEQTIRGLSGATIIVIDEAALVEQEIVYALEPMLATTDGPRWALTSARGRLGWFHEEWTGDDPEFVRVKVTADDCPHIPKSYIDRKRRRWPKTKFEREFFCKFEDPDDAVFSADLIGRMFSSTSEVIRL